MTQPPPPPPNQPPGFGAPKDQPPQPQPPAQQPGYGYPQAPQAPQPPQAPQTPPPAAPATPPTPPAGYGYPGQQPEQPQPPYGQPQPPNPYSQPTQPYGQPHPYGQPNAYGQQPGYGYPQQTMPMQPQPAPGGGRKINPQLAIIVSAVVAIALIVGGGLWYASSGDDSKKDDTAGSSGGTGGGGDEKGDTGGTSGKGEEKVPANTAASVLFQVPQPKPPQDTTYTVNGSWLTDTVYAKSGIAEVVGYDPAKGTELWTVKLPGPVCEASRHATEDGFTAIAFEPKMPTKDSTAGCSQVGAIDLNTGKLLWTKTGKSGDRLINWDNVTVSAGTVATGSTSGGAAWDIKTGKSLWTPKPTDTCYDAGYGGGEKLVAVRKCGHYGNRELSIQTIDPASGKVISEYKMSQGIEYASVVSTEPLVVAAEVGEVEGAQGISDVFAIDNKTGKLRSHISVPADRFTARCDGITRIEYCKMVVVGNDRLYLPTEERETDSETYSRTNEIVSFDLATGKETGQRADAGDGYSITPLRMDGANLLAYKRPPYDKGGQVVSIDGGTFKETKLLENPSTDTVRDVETSMLPDYSELLYKDGRFFMSQVYASDFGSSSGDKEYLAVAFGAK
ncbi:PQQ-binding-like beta-propeller repeat protein [Streptomyces sp. NPDC090106]|uniref:outer membrane protein assembly factor BamB family protein n=1 Tax=Streptomyces sp. NPDC090106 TaxID=3365946 RepID=UPI00381BA09E